MDFPSRIARTRSRKNLTLDEDVPIPVLKKDVKEVVAQWRVPLRGKIYNIEFEHGTTSGKRVIWIDGKVSNSPLCVDLNGTTCRLLSVSIIHCYLA